LRVEFTMKAIRVYEFGAPEVMKLEEVPDLKPQAGQVVVRVQAAGVNPVDAYLRSGNYGQLPLPYTPGMDGAGTIEAVGEGVEMMKVGDRVWFGGTITGAYAEKALCEAGQVHPLPDKLSFAQGAAVGIPYGTAYRALWQRGQARPGEVVLVHGASGGVGIAAVQIACAGGMVVIGTAGTEAGRQLVREQGAQQVLDHKDAAHFQQALEITSGKGVDIIIELLANVNLAEDLKILARHGRVMVVGNRGPIQIDPRDTMGREADIRGVMSGSDIERAQMYAAIGAGLENGTLRPVIGQELPLAEAARAHHEIMETAAMGKRVLIT
jgi:NADPH:quinone reductase